jgi:uncharacterized protein (DUF433 family)
MTDWRQYVVSDPSICGGQPTIRGTRVTLRVVLGALAAGKTPEEVMRHYPSLTEEAVRAVIAFAAASAEEDLPVPATPGSHAD